MAGKVNSFGENLRKIRKAKSLLLRQVAAYLEVDTAFVSKLERGDKNATKAQVLKLAEFLKIPNEKLLELWLADKVMNTLQGEQQSEDAIRLVSKQLKTLKKKK